MGGLSREGPRLANDIDETGAGGFLAAHHVSIIGPDMGIELIKVVKRLEVVQEVYPLPPTVEIYSWSARESART